MARKSFTSEEKETLRANPYTSTVTDRQISFTAAFKSAFWEAECSGMKPKQIFMQLGYDPEILGTNRVASVAASIRKEVKQDGGFHTGRRPWGSVAAENADSDLQKKVEELQARVDLLEHQMNFLKKVTPVRVGRSQEIS